MKNRITRQSGLTLLEVLFLVIVIILITAIAMLSRTTRFGSKSNNQRYDCINNLRAIDSAKQQWALDQNRWRIDIPQGHDLQPYLGSNLPFCPADPAKTFATSIMYHS
jgi:Tfp pilus assembly protein PilV